MRGSATWASLARTLRRLSSRWWRRLRSLSGVFDPFGRMLIPRVHGVGGRPHCGTVRVVTWNARALLQWRGRLGSTKLKYLQSLGCGSTILSLQEVRQDGRQVRDFLKRVVPGSEVFTSCFTRDGVGLACGGVATAVPRALGGNSGT
eukprot:8803912-Pyramimonas_sp.AAC.1